MPTGLDWWSMLEDFSSNPSVAAFLGAAAAFLLVMATDKMRLSRRRAAFYHVLNSARDLAARKYRAATEARELFEEKMVIHPGEIMPFPTEQLESLLLEVCHRLKAPELASASAVIFVMRATDNLIREVGADAEALYNKTLNADSPWGQEERRLANRLLVNYNAVVSNLENSFELISKLLAGDHRGISMWSYAPGRAEDVVRSGRE